MENCTGIPANPDIAGIGIRVSVYVQSFVIIAYPLLALALSKGEFRWQPERLAPDRIARHAILMTGFGLLTYSVVQATTQQLSVFHALIMLNLSWIVSLTAWSSATAANLADMESESNAGAKERKGFFLLMAPGSVIPGINSDPPRYGSRNAPRSSPRGLFGGWMCMVHLTFMSAVGIWLFSNVLHFDPTSAGCTPGTVYVIFGHRVSLASAHLRVFWLVVYSAGLVPVLNALLLAVAKLPLNFAVSVVGGAVYGLGLGLIVGESSESDSYGSSHWEVVHHVYAPRLADLGAALALNCCLIASIEGMLASNISMQPGVSSWTFGQTLALFLVLPAVAAIVKEARTTRKLPKERDQAPNVELHGSECMACGESSKSAIPLRRRLSL